MVCTVVQFIHQRIAPSLSLSLWGYVWGYVIYCNACILCDIIYICVVCDSMYRHHIAKACVNTTHQDSLCCTIRGEDECRQGLDLVLFETLVAGDMLR